MGLHACGRHAIQPASLGTAPPKTSSEHESRNTGEPSRGRAPS